MAGLQLLVGLGVLGLMVALAVVVVYAATRRR
jgi:hypothetical protein